jgi:hypothetical protein
LVGSALAARHGQGDKAQGQRDEGPDRSHGNLLAGAATTITLAGHSADADRPRPCSRLVSFERRGSTWVTPSRQRPGLAQSAKRNAQDVRDQATQTITRSWTLLVVPPGSGPTVAPPARPGPALPGPESRRPARRPTPGGGPGELGLAEVEILRVPWAMGAGGDRNLAADLLEGQPAMHPPVTCGG